MRTVRRRRLTAAIGLRSAMADSAAGLARRRAAPAPAPAAARKDETIDKTSELQKSSVTFSARERGDIAGLGDSS